MHHLMYYCRLNVFIQQRRSFPSITGILRHLVNVFTLRQALLIHSWYMGAGGEKYYKDDYKDREFFTSAIAVFHFDRLLHLCFLSLHTTDFFR